MTDLEKIKETVINAIDDFVTPEVKAKGIALLKEQGLPKLTEIETAVLAKLEKSAVNESGWCLFRDKYFYPALIRIAHYLLEKALDKMEAAANAELEGSDAPAEQSEQE